MLKYQRKNIFNDYLESVIYPMNNKLLELFYLQNDPTGTYISVEDESNAKLYKESNEYLKLDSSAAKKHKWFRSKNDILLEKYKLKPTRHYSYYYYNDLKKITNVPLEHDVYDFFKKGIYSKFENPKEITKWFYWLKDFIIFTRYAEKIVFYNIENDGKISLSANDEDKKYSIKFNNLAHETIIEIKYEVTKIDNINSNFSTLENFLETGESNNNIEFVYLTITRKFGKGMMNQFKSILDPNFNFTYSYEYDEELVLSVIKLISKKILSHFEVMIMELTKFKFNYPTYIENRNIILRLEKQFITLDEPVIIDKLNDITDDSSYFKNYTTKPILVVSKRI